MPLLKHEMRAMFEKNLNLSILGPQAILDEGLLRQIAYLSFLNPNVFPRLDWRVLCVKSSSSKTKLYSYCSTDQRIEDCAAALIFYTDTEEHEYLNNDYYINLLKISIMYSCRLNQVDFEVVKINNYSSIKEYFKLPETAKLQVIITLGVYKSTDITNSKKFLGYDQAVKEV